MKHHYIPCFYTSQWAGSDGQLCEYSRPYKKVVPRRVHPAATGYEENLYTIPEISKDKEQLLETMFMKKIDQSANDVMEKLLNNQLRVVGNDQRIYWVVFLLSLLQRTPEKIIELGINTESILDNLVRGLKDRYLSVRGAHDPQTYEEFVQNFKNSGYFNRSKKMMLQHAILLDRTVTLICSFQWHVKEMPESHHKLLTSDRPVIMTNGLAKSDGHLVIPISPRHLFIAGRTKDVVMDIVSLRNLAEISNEIVARRAQKYVYGAEDRQLLFVERRLGKVVTIIDGRNNAGIRED